MTATPWLYINSQHLFGSHGSGWRQTLPESSGMPAATEVIERLDLAVFENKKLSILLEDDLMLPLQVELDKKVSQKELSQYLLWKLKRHLPYPTDQIELRYIPLEDGKRYLTFSIPKFWLQPLFDGLKARGVHVGFIGGVFLTLLDQYKASKDKLMLCVYRDFYLMTQVDKKGRMLWFRTRRLPYNDQDQLDLATWVHSDLAPVIEGEAKGKAVNIFDFSATHSAHHSALRQALTAKGADVTLLPDNGAGAAANPLALFRNLVEG